MAKPPVHPHDRAMRRRMAFQILLNAVMFAWMLWVMLTYQAGQGLASLGVVIGVWIVANMVAGLYAGFAALPSTGPTPKPYRVQPPSL